MWATGIELVLIARQEPHRLNCLLSSSFESLHSGHLHTQMSIYSFLYSILSKGKTPQASHYPEDVLSDVFWALLLSAELKA